MMGELFLLLICIVGSAFASGSETALVSASRIRLQHMAGNGQPKARKALYLLDRKERFLVVTLIATNVFNVAGGAISTLALQRWIGPIGPVLATLAMTSVLLVLSEIVPKAYFRHHAERTLVLAADLWKWVFWILMPITYPIYLFSRFLFRLCGCEPTSVYSKSREDIKLVIEESVESGGLQEDQQEMLESTLSYSNTIAREVMVPISEVALLPEDARTDECLDLVREQGHTRIPIYRERVDQIVGLINVFDILYDGHRTTYIRPYMRQISIIPETRPIDDLFVELQRSRETLAVVVNEFGACIGIVTLEDIMEEIFGELADEHEDATPPIQEKDKGHYLVSGKTDIDDLGDETGIVVAKEGFETVGGYILHRLGYVPKKGETFQDGNMTITVLEADRYSVKTVELVRDESANTDADRMS